MTRHRFGDFACSIARAADVVGDSWTPLILRDLLLGVATFEAIVRDLGISRALLSARLDQLIEEGIVATESYSTRPVRNAYVLTSAGLELAPILIALMQWGDRWRAPDGAPMLVRHACGHDLEATLRCDACGGEVTAASVAVRPGPGGRRAPGTTVLAERLAGAGASTGRTDAA